MSDWTSDWTSSISREKTGWRLTFYLVIVRESDPQNGRNIQVKDFFQKLPRFYLLVAAYPPGNSAGDLFGMDKWPLIKGCWWPPIGGYKGHGSNHLESIALKFWRLTFYLLVTAYPCICYCLSSAFFRKKTPWWISRSASAPQKTPGVVRIV